MKKLILILPFLLLFLSCGNNTRDLYQYHRFENEIWNRFDKINYVIQVRNPGMYDVFFEATCKPDFEREYFSFNMVMNTPSGEERINEYAYRIRDSIGNFRGSCTGDSCLIVIPLKKGIELGPGELKIEIENLIPYVETSGIRGAALRLAKLR